MKFTKVNNYKAAVITRVDDPQAQTGLQQSNGVSEEKTGFLYRDPGKFGKSIVDDVDGHVETQVKAAQKLYKIFNPVEKGILDKGDEKSLVAGISLIIDNAINDKRDLDDGTLKAEKMYARILKEWKEKGTVASGEQIDAAVDLYLRKTLYQKCAGKVKLLLKAVSDHRHWNTLTNEEKEAIEGFYEELKNDYQYKKIKKNAAKSIEHQNIVIQPNKSGVLTPSVIPLAKKRSKIEKDALTSFLSDYAVLDDAVRHDLRIRLRRLVDLYFFGSGEVPVGDFDEWKDHSDRRVREESFSEEACAFIEDARKAAADRESKKKTASFKSDRTPKDGKDRINIVRQMYREENIRRYRMSVKAVTGSSIAASTDPSDVTAKAHTETGTPFLTETLYFRDMNMNMFWLRHIENSVERIYKNFRSLEDYRLSTGYLSEKVWKGMLSFLSGKYIATGKAVYHFAMEEAAKKESVKVLQSSEIVKAQETPVQQGAKETPDTKKGKGAKKKANRHKAARSERVVKAAAADRAAAMAAARAAISRTAESAPAPETVLSKARLEDPDISLALGKIRDDLKGGLTSFDYEMIKAEEVLQRDTAIHVAFAANHLSSATVDLSVLKGEKNKEDFLTLERADLERALKSGQFLRRNILQFFGGASTWSDFPFDRYYQAYAQAQGCPYDDLSFLDDLKKIVFAMRNETFHFETRRRNQGNWNRGLIAAMFEHDCVTASKLQKGKFYSNNLPMFYSEKDLLDLLKALYSTQASRASQVPSFNKVVVRGNFSNYISDELRWKTISFPGEDSVARKEQFDSALYYLLKEMYYNLFLQGKGLQRAYNVTEEFIKWCSDEENGKENPYAFTSYKSRVMDIVRSKNDITLAEICQRIMTDYNLYNNQSRKVKNNYVRKNIPDSYDHFKMLLLKGLREVFAAYIRKELDHLKTPVYRKMPDADAFLPGYSAPTYNSLVSKVREDADLQKWYIIGRLLNPRQANFLVGILRQYVQYTGQIRRRAKETGSTPAFQVNPRSFRPYEGVVDVCIQLAGTTTNCLEDYFEDKDGYARHVAMYLDFEGKYPGISISAQLEQFCNENIDVTDRTAKVISDDDNPLNASGTAELKRLGVFYDAENPILNRNILLSRIYGTEKVLSAALKDKKVTRSDIQAFYAQRKKIDAYRITGKCTTKEQQQDLKKYQELKNKVEFRNLVEYEEIIDEVQAQMIDWCYLRERDLMYFQLGFHYTCLNNDSPKAPLYQRIEHEGRTIDGAILYQIAAMYIVGIPIYSFKNRELMISRGSMPVWKKINAFVDYSRGCLEQSPGSDTVEKEISKKESESIYFAGMELFENTHEHDNIVSLRNYIEHFHYYTLQDRSLLDLCGEIFDRFFSYDLKYQKSVLVLLYNILMHHFVRPAFTFSTSQKQVGTGKNTMTKSRAAITLSRGQGLFSEKMTYKLSEPENDKGRSNKSSLKKADNKTKKTGEIKLDAKSEDFLKGLATILCFPDSPECLI